MQYRLYGVTLTSTIAFPELEPVCDPSPAVTLERRDSPVDPAGWTPLPPRTLSNDQIAVAVSVRDAAYLLRFVAGPEFVLSADGSRIECCRPAGVPESKLRHIFIDEVMPLAIGHAGALVLHASACRTVNGAVAFAGRSGAGKSTLAASFALRGAPMIADDALVLERDGTAMLARSAYRAVKIWPDVFRAFAQAGALGGVDDERGKRRIGPGDGPLIFDEGRVPLRRVYVLDETSDGEEAVATLSRRAALIELLKHTFAIDFGDRRRLAAEFDRLVRDSAVIDVRRLTYPHQLRRLPSVLAAIRGDLGIGG